MKIFERNEHNKFCGHWNDSPLEIGMVRLRAIPEGEQLHSHDFKEYYLIISGKVTLQVEDAEYQLSDGMLSMVDAGEKHQVTYIDPDEGGHWVIIKEKSDPYGKKVSKNLTG